MCIRTLKTLTELEEIRYLWQSWSGHHESEIDYYLHTASSSHETVRPHVLLLSRAGIPEAILVGRLDRRRLPFKLGYFRLSIKANVLFFVGGALRGADSPENCRLFVQHICRSLTSGEADLAYFHHVSTDSTLHTWIRSAPGFLNRDHVWDIQPHFSRSIPATVEEFQRSLSHKRRQRANKLVKDFPNAVRVQCYSDLNGLEIMLRDVERVARKSYQRGLGVGFFDTPAERERLILKARRGWLRAYVLHIQEEPVAFWIGDLSGNTFGSDYLAHGPEFAKYSPGLYLILKAMEDLCSRVTQVDFGSGSAEYKKVLSDRQWDEGSVYIFASSFKGFRLKAMRLLTDGVHLTGKRVLDRMGILLKVRKAWRSRLSASTGASPVGVRE